MIRYETRNFLRILVGRKGSVVQKCIPLSIAMAVVGFGLAMLRKLDYSERVFMASDYIFDNFSGQMVCVVIGYLLITRTNTAFNRWMEGVDQVQTMHAQWIAAFDQLISFLSRESGSPEDMERIHHFRARIGHWFVLLSCVATAGLRNEGQPPLDLIPIWPKYPKVIAGRKSSFTASASLGMTPEQNMAKMALFEEMLKKFQKKGVDTLKMSVLHEPTEEEVLALQDAPNMCYTISNWILQSIMIEVRFGTLDCPLPILSMVYSNLSAGILAYHQSLKVARVPFPFPFAQMVMIILVMLFAVSPFYIDVFTQAVGLTTSICFVLPICYYGINMISADLENVFGMSANSVEIEERHESFVTWVEDVLQQPMVPPKSSVCTLEKDIWAGVTETRTELLEEQVVRIASRMSTPASNGPTSEPLHSHAAVAQASDPAAAKLGKTGDGDESPVAPRKSVLAAAAAAATAAAVAAAAATSS